MNKLCAIVIGAALAVSAQAAPWTYRGSLSDGGKPAHGRYDLRLSVLDAGGRQALLPPLTLYGVEVREGAFAVDVDFGVDLAELGAVSLRTEVGQGGSGFVALGSPQPFDAKAALAGVCWDTQGNAGTNPATDFLGTTDAQPLVLRVNNLTGARLQANALSINWTAGYDAQAASGSSAVSIGGGSVQRAWANGSTIAGGANNVAGNASAFPDVQLGPTVGGGIGNLARGSYATVAGGNSNIAQGSATTVAGGSGNKAIGNFATVTGGSEACAGGAIPGPADSGCRCGHRAAASNVPTAAIPATVMATRAVSSGAMRLARRWSPPAPTSSSCAPAAASVSIPTPSLAAMIWWCRRVPRRPTLTPICAWSRAPARPP